MSDTPNNSQDNDKSYIEAFLERLRTAYPSSPISRMLSKLKVYSKQKPKLMKSDPKPFSHTTHSNDEEGNS